MSYMRLLYKPHRTEFRKSSMFIDNSNVFAAVTLTISVVEWHAVCLAMPSSDELS